MGKHKNMKGKHRKKWRGQGGRMEHRNEFKKAVHIKENTRRHD